MDTGLFVTGKVLPLERGDNSTFHERHHRMLKARSWGDEFKCNELLFFRHSRSTKEVAKFQVICIWLCKIHNRLNKSEM